MPGSRGVKGTIEGGGWTACECGVYAGKCMET